MNRKWAFGVALVAGMLLAGLTCARVGTDELLDASFVTLKTQIGVTPTEATIDTGKTQAFKLTGLKPYSAKIISGSGSVTATDTETYTFTAPESAVNTIVQFSAADGTTQAVTVQINQAPLEPSQISGNVLWLKADAITPVSDGTVIATWPDSSGLAKNFTSASGPTYLNNCLNSKPCLQFNGTSQNMSRAHDSALNPTIMTFIAIFKSDVNDLATREIYYAINNAPTSGFNLQIDPYAGTASLRQYTWAVGDGWFFVLPVQKTVSTSIWETWHMAIDSQNNRILYRAGAIQFFASSAGINWLPMSGASQYIGSNGVPGNYFQGKLAEIMIFNVVLTDDQRRAIQCYLKNKYALSYFGCGV